MDDEREVREYQAMNHQAVNDRFVSDLVSAGSVGPHIVDLGCGTGEIPVLLCQKRDDLQVLGIDSSIEMLEAARIEVEIGGMLGRVFLEHADCKTLTGFESGTTNTVISNTMLHHLADPKCAIVQALRILAPGGRLFIRDLARPMDSGSVEALVRLHADDDSDFAKQLLRQSLHAALTVDEVCELLAEFEIPKSNVRMTSDRHWTLDWTSL